LKTTALIIFARRPVAGKVKTRLAADIGDEAALRIYLRLLAHTREVALHSQCDAFVFLTELPPDQFWDGFNTALQPEGDLGERMLHAFLCLFEKGYKRVVIIGSDCPDLAPADVDLAFDALAGTDVVIGPAADGGYYLLGLKQPHEMLFRNKTWSSDTVLSQTLQDIHDYGLRHTMLRQLHDVDKVKDVPPGWLEG
jgi:rSAM/selenodomain-associated transferase 1